MSLQGHLCPACLCDQVATSDRTYGGSYVMGVLRALHCEQAQTLGELCEKHEDLYRQGEQLVRLRVMTEMAGGEGGAS